MAALTSRRREWGRRLVRALPALFVLLAGQAGAVETSSAKEYQLKAVFLFNFARFVSWPEAAFARPTDPFVIGVVGVDPFGAALDETVRGETIEGHPLEVRRYQTAGIAECHILFVSSSENPRLEAILDRLANRPILTVSDLENAARRGVMIRFIQENKRIRFRINVDATKRAGLIISSKLLRTAEIVGEGP